MRARLALAAFAIVAVVADSAPAAAWGLPGDDELTALRATKPHAAELIEQGEAHASRGDFRGADASFQAALAEASEASLPWRRHCEALTALGDRRNAIAACTEAIGRRHTGITLRALVGALVEGPTPPTMQDVLLALKVTARERHLTPWLPTAAAATCDIAMSIGDGVMLEQCAGELERLAPDDPMTRRARERLALRCPPWRFWTGWLAIAAAIAVTMGHALRRRLAPRMRKAAAIAVAGAMGLLAIPGAARADETPPAESNSKALAAGMAQHHLSKWPVDDAEPAAHIPSVADRNADPMEFGYWLQDLTAKGTLASRLGHHAVSVKFFSTLASIVPERAIAYSKMCNEYEAMGDLQLAINSCGDAILRDGVVVQDYIHFVTLVLSEPGELSAKEVAALGNVVTHMREDPAAAQVVDEIECQIATRTANVAQLQECTAPLAARAPDDAKTISYQWALAVEQGHFGDAVKLLDRAKAAGVPQDVINRMQKRTAERRMGQAMQVLRWLAAAALLGAGLFFGVRVLRRRRPAPAPESASATA